MKHYLILAVSKQANLAFPVDTLKILDDAAQSAQDYINHLSGEVMNYTTASRLSHAWRVYAEQLGLQAAVVPPVEKVYIQEMGTGSCGGFRTRLVASGDIVTQEVYSTNKLLFDPETNTWTEDRKAADRVFVAPADC